jgi:hypothetical protein
MNNTTTTKRNLTAIAAVFMAAVLVLGGTLVTAAFASNNNSGNTVTAQINKQKASQSGFDGTQEQEAQNTICTHPESDASCVSEGAAAAVVPTKLTCEQCFTKFLTPDQISDVIDNLKIKDVTTLADLCAFLQGNITDEETLLLAAINAGIPLTTAKELTQCLKDAGIVFTT